MTNPAFNYVVLLSVLADIFFVESMVMCNPPRGLAGSPGAHNKQGADDVKMRQYYKQQPVIGSIYRDKSGNSLAVVNIIGNKALLEYANATITSVALNNWQLLHAKSAIF